ncbi:hypothetical protein [Polaromonas sp.]|uniref:hypothetical protein n=1 Tax=Polaromonas sp. TaxID=1869339 RepID=UPI003BB50FA1
MNKRQAQRIALAINGAELIVGECPEVSSLSDADSLRLGNALKALGWNMLERAGFHGDAPDMQPIVRTVLGPPASTGI